MIFTILVFIEILKKAF